LEKEFIEGLKGHPGDFRSLYSLGALLSLEGRYAESAGYFGQAESGFDRRTPGAETLYFNYALTLTKAGQPDKAIEKYLQALRIDQDFIEAHYNLALIYIEKQDYRSAIEHLTEVLSQAPTHTRANVTLARIYAAQGKWAPARERLQQALKGDPQNAQAVSLLQQLPVK
jgi:tetratricopeptide (TPR) repeat protein